MEMQIPYDEFELRLALIGLEDDDFDDKKLDKLENELKHLIPEDGKELKKKIAQYNGIEVIDLINSPNYKILCAEFKVYAMQEIVKRLKEELNLTDKQAWAIIAMKIGLLD